MWTHMKPGIYEQGEGPQKKPSPPTPCSQTFSLQNSEGTTAQATQYRKLMNLGVIRIFCLW